MEEFFMNGVQNNDLSAIAKQIRYYTIDEIATLGVGHIGGSLSIADLLAVLYFSEMNIDPQNPKMEDRDRLVVSKGHAGPVVYATLALKGYFPLEMLHTLNKPNTTLPSHCDMLKTPGVDMTAGSLGQGISCAVGMAKAAKIMQKDCYIYCIIGDGESQEGQVWEALMAASHLGLDNLIIFLDYNHMQIDGTTDNIMNIDKPADRFASFGFDVYDIDGHDIDAIQNSIHSAKTKKGVPSIVVMNTVKGKGVSFVEAAKVDCHSMTFTEEQKQQALAELV